MELDFEVKTTMDQVTFWKLQYPEYKCRILSVEKRLFRSDKVCLFFTYCKEQ